MPPVRSARRRPEGRPKCAAASRWAPKPRLATSDRHGRLHTPAVTGHGAGWTRAVRRDCGVLPARSSSKPPSGEPVLPGFLVATVPRRSTRNVSGTPKMPKAVSAGSPDRSRTGSPGPCPAPPRHRVRTRCRPSRRARPCDGSTSVPPLFVPRWPSGGCEPVGTVPDPDAPHPPPGRYIEQHHGPIGVVRHRHPPADHREMVRCAC
jgi:hypothetical protein